MNKIRFYLDENIAPTVAEQLRQHDIDIITVRDLGQLGDSDVNHLHRASDMNRVLCTQDTDFLRLATEWMNHAGIMFISHRKASVGDIVRGLRLLHNENNAEQMQGQVHFL